MSDDGKIRLGDSEPLCALIARALTDAICIETLYCHKRDQQLEMELIGNHSYEDATSGTEAAGPARERVRDVLRLHGETKAYMEGLAGLSVRIAAEGLDARLTEEEVRTLADVLEHAGEFTRTQVAEGPCLEVTELDREIMDKMPLPEDELRKLSEELAREDGMDHVQDRQDHKVIDITRRIRYA